MKQVNFINFEGEKKEKKIKKNLLAISRKQIFILNLTPWWQDVSVSCPEGQSMIPQPSLPGNHYLRVSLDQP